MYKISVIVPVYKVEDYLEKCIESIINQTYTNLEIILVDDGSPDNCPTICEEYAAKDNRIQVIHKENGGVSSARNIGLDIAAGEYVLFIDADDWLELDMCEYLVNNAIRYNADISCCGFYKERVNSSEINCLPGDIHLETNKSCFQAYLEKDYFNISIWNKLFRRTILLNRFDESLSIGEDAYFLFKTVLISNRAIFGQKAKYHYNVRDYSATQSGLNLNSFDTLNFVDRVVNDISKYDPDYVAKANSLRFDEYIAIFNKILYYDKEHEYTEQFNRTKQCIIKMIQMKKNGIKLPKIKVLAFNLFLFNKKLYVYLIKKYYDFKTIKQL